MLCPNNLMRSRSGILFSSSHHVCIIWLLSRWQCQKQLDYNKFKFFVQFFFESSVVIINRLNKLKQLAKFSAKKKLLSILIVYVSANSFTLVGTERIQSTKKKGKQCFGLRCVNLALVKYMFSLSFIKYIVLYL